MSALDLALDRRAARALRPRARPTWSFQPDDATRSVVTKEMNRRAGRGGSKRGLRTKILNEALRAHLRALISKRELAV